MFTCYELMMYIVFLTLKIEFILSSCCNYSVPHLSMCSSDDYLKAICLNAFNCRAR